MNIALKDFDFCRYGIAPWTGQPGGAWQYPSREFSCSTEFQAMNADSVIAPPNKIQVLTGTSLHSPDPSITQGVLRFQLFMWSPDVWMNAKDIESHPSFFIAKQHDVIIPAMPTAHAEFTSLTSDEIAAVLARPHIGGLCFGFRVQAADPLMTPIVHHAFVRFHNP